MTDDPAVLELLTEIRDALRNGNRLAVVMIDELRGLRDILERKAARRKSRSLSAADVAALSALLPKIAAAIGKESCTVHSLNEAASTRTAKAKALRAALAATGCDSPQLGRLLVRGANTGTQIAGFYLHKTGRSRNGVTIRVDTEPRDHRTAYSATAGVRATLDP